MFAEALLDICRCHMTQVGSAILKISLCPHSCHIFDQAGNVIYTPTFKNVPPERVRTITEEVTNIYLDD